MVSFISQVDNVLIKFKTRPAVGYWEDWDTYRIITYEAIQILCSKYTENLTSCIKEKFICVGLYMEHNCYIPAIIISERNLEILQLLNIKWIISHSNKDDFLKDHCSMLAEIGENTLILWRLNLKSEVNCSFKNIFYVICTSGTTGQPKFVKVTEESIMANINNLRDIFKLSEDDTIYSGTPLTFDPSMVELLLSLTTGCMLLIVPYKIKINHTKLLTKLFPKNKLPYEGITVLQIVPSLFFRWSTNDIKYILEDTSCRILAFGGEKFPEDIVKWKRSTHLRLFNVYGITEVSCWASILEVIDSNQKVTLGKPFCDTILQVRNNGGLEIINGEGELFIGKIKTRLLNKILAGTFSRICYINDETELNVDKPVFRGTGDIVQIDNERNITYISRKDSIIKRLGHRINMLQLEQMIFSELNILNAAIWLEQRHKLVLFVVMEDYNANSKSKIIDKIRVKLLHSIPKHCFPDYVEIIEHLPLTSHGKTNRRALEDLYAKLSDQQSFANCTPLVLFQTLWTKYLGIAFEEADIHDDLTFFDFGGNSILAVQLLKEFNEVVGSDMYAIELTKHVLEGNLRECLKFVNNLSPTVPIKKRKREEINRANEIVPLSRSYESNLTLSIKWKYDFGACVDCSPTIFEKGNESKCLVDLHELRRPLSILPPIPENVHMWVH